MKRGRWLKNDDRGKTDGLAVERRVCRERKGNVAAFVSVNLLVLLTLALFPLYCDYMWNGAGSDKSVCLFTRLFRLYCPFCGVTRSIWYLMRFDLVNAFIFSPFAFTAAVVFIYCDIRAFIALLKGKERISRLSPWISKLLVAVLALTFIVRNILLVFCGYDPLGNIKGLM